MRRLFEDCWPFEVTGRPYTIRSKRAHRPLLMYHLIPARSVATFPREELGWYKVHSWCRFYCFLVRLAHDGDFRGFLVGLAHDGDFFSEKMDTAKTIRIAKLHFESPNPK